MTTPEPRLRRLAKWLPGARALARLARRLLSPDHREIHRLQRDERGRLLQPFPTTSDDRYPRLFDALAERLAAVAQPRILSFGCASGEELRALRRRIPQARIVGIDLNRRAIAAAQAADPNPLSEYRCDGAPRADDRFDAVLALAVFRHGELALHRPPDCSAILPFARFAEGLEQLDRVLEPGGWLLLYNQHFRLADTALAASYDADPLRAEPGNGQLRGLTLLYGPDDQRIEGACETAVLFRKRGRADPGGSDSAAPGL